MALELTSGQTHWDVKPKVRRISERFAARNPITWNTYKDHPKGYHLDDVSVDYWGPSGRGDPISQHIGTLIAGRLLQRRARTPIAWLIWNGRIWQSSTGWQPYNGWQGMHYDHVHVTFRMYSNTAGRTP